MIGIIGAMDIEVNNIIANITKLEKWEMGQLSFYSGKIEDIDVCVVKCGIGKVNAAITASLMISKYQPQIIINTGIAGGINLDPESLFVCDDLLYYDVDVRAFGYKLVQVPGLPERFLSNKKIKEAILNVLKNKNIPFFEGTIYSGDSFLSNSTRLNDFDIKKEAAVEMEGAAIAQVCTKLEVDFASIRFISDRLDTSNHIADYQSFETEAAMRSSIILMEVIKGLSI